MVELRKRNFTIDDSLQQYLRYIFKMALHDRDTEENVFNELKDSLRVSKNNKMSRQRAMFEFSTAKVLQQIPNWKHLILNADDWAAPLQLPLSKMTD
eukprot:15191649-Alexandrium_andersonii.AAC.1